MNRKNVEIEQSCRDVEVKNKQLFSKCEKAKVESKKIEDKINEDIVNELMV